MILFLIMNKVKMLNKIRF